MIILPPKVGEDLKLGPRFQMVPFDFTWFNLKLDTTDGGVHVKVLRFGTPHGYAGYAFDLESAQAFARAAVESASGLVIPPTTKGLHNGNG